MTATPRAPVSGCSELRTPEAQPASASATCARAKSNKGEMSMPSAVPSRGCGASSCRLLFDPGVVRRSGDRVGQLGSAVDAELAEGVAEVPFDGLAAEVELPGDL